MLLTDQHPHNKSITVAVLGVPNAGKSSLINTLVGTDLSIVTSKPQTTRNKIQCIFSVDHTEVILVDTPGLHRSNQELNKRLNEQARDGAEGADLNLLLVDLTGEVLRQLVEIKEGFEDEFGPSWLVFTKSDLVKNAAALPLEEIFAKAKEIIPSLERFLFVSAKQGENMNILTGALCEKAKPGPHLFPNGEISNKTERFFASEYVREAAFELLKEELPYELAVVIDEYQDFREKEEVSKLTCHISATIVVNRPSQRAIVVGSRGSMIKEIGMRARHKIEVMVGGQVHLNLHVKVIPKWFKNNFVLEEIGLPRAKDSARVWRKK